MRRERRFDIDWSTWLIVFGEAAKTRLELLLHAPQFDSHSICLVYALPFHHVRISPGKTAAVLQQDDEREDVVIEVAT